jgi:hypothetical protein
MKQPEWPARTNAADTGCASTKAEEIVVSVLRCHAGAASVANPAELAAPRDLKMAYPRDPYLAKVAQASEPQRENLVYAEVLSCCRGVRVGDDGLYVLVLRDLKRPPLLTSG